MMRNSVGNITEILDLLDKEKYSGEEITVHYQQLVEKWGEWEITGSDSGGLVIRYINIGNALFSGLMIVFCVFMFLTFVSCIVLGKIVFPALAKHYTNCNEEMVDLATLQSATQINEMHNKKQGEWF